MAGGLGMGVVLGRTFLVLSTALFFAIRLWNAEGLEELLSKTGGITDCPVSTPAHFLSWYLLDLFLLSRFLCSSSSFSAAFFCGLFLVKLSYPFCTWCFGSSSGCLAVATPIQWRTFDIQLGNFYLVFLIMFILSGLFLLFFLHCEG